MGKEGAWSPPGDGRGASGGWQSWREVGDEDEDPDEVRSEPRDVEGDFMARCSSGLTKKKQEFNKLVLILSLQEHYSKNRREVFFFFT